MIAAGIAAGNSVTDAQPHARPTSHASRSGCDERFMITAAVKPAIRQPAVTAWPMNSVAYGQAGVAKP